MKENMGLFDRFFKKQKKTKVEEPVQEKKPRKPKVKKEIKLSDKEIATQNNEPYIHITKMSVDPNNINNGAFELDFNDKFVLNLVRAGYKVKPTDSDNEIVDRWFQTVCRNIALELYEQDQADPENRYRAEMRVVLSKDLGDGRSEVS
jgi:hypothetical protein